MRPPPRSGLRAVNRFLTSLKPLPAVPAPELHRAIHTVEPTAQLFGVPYLREPADFKKAAQVAVQVCDPLVAKITQAPADDGLKTLWALDIISDTLCKVLDAAECTRNVHSTEEWRSAAEETFNALASYMYNLNANVPLYQALKQLTDDPAQMQKLTEEQRRMALLLRREFERDGIHLDDASRNAVIELNNEIGGLTGEFMSRVHHSAPVKFSVSPAGPVLCCLPDPIKEHLPPRTFAEKVAGASGSVSLTTEAMTVEFLLRLCRDAGVREAVLRTANVDHHDSTSVIHRLVAARARLASLIGFDSYASLVASDRMAGEPGRVISFLRTLSKALLPRLALELAELSQAAAAEAVGGAARKAYPAPDAAAAAKQAEASAVNATPLRQLYQEITGALGGAVQLSDLPYLSRAVTAARFWGLEPGAGLPKPPTNKLMPTPVVTTPAPDPQSVDSAQASQYLPLSAALEGLSMVMRRVFGVTMVRVPLSKGEAWDGSDAWGGMASNHSSNLVKMVLRHETEGALGVLYLDPFARPGKFGGAAHFVVRCGKRLHAGDGAFESAMGVDMSGHVSSLGPSAAGPAQSFQLPIITLVTSMAKPEEHEARNVKDPLNAVLLTPGELETLFHEFGHALHSLLSRTEFQHLSGTRGALDFVELPSHVMEYWARDARAVLSYAKHYKTGAPMPSDLWARIQAARTSFMASELSTSIAHAAFDQALHGDEASRAAVGLGPDVAPEQLKAIASAALSAVGGPGSALKPKSTRVQPWSIVPEGYLSSDELTIPLSPSDTLRPMPAAGDVAALADKAQDTTDTGKTKPLESTPLYHAMAATYTMPTLPASTPGNASYAWHAKFTHLATYGGGYYTYLYATAFSAAVWHKLFAADPFSRSAGDTYRKVVLSRGAASDPCTMIATLLGGQPSLEALLTELELLPPKQEAKAQPEQGHSQGTAAGQAVAEAQAQATEGKIEASKAA